MYLLLFEDYLVVQTHKPYQIDCVCIGNSETRGSKWDNKENVYIYDPRHEISNDVVYATSKASDQPAHTRSLIRAFASRLV